jgi:3'(2'), 5'-bisphosphate nucleotidase
MPDYAKLLSAGRRAVAEASFVCRQVQRALDQVRAITKDDKSPVTVADYASQAIVARRLKSALGHVHLVGEEGTSTLRALESQPHRDATLAAVREVWPDCSENEMLDAIDTGSGEANHTGFWTLDPVDGTKGFLRNQQYAIALAYIEHGRPVVGILGCPNLPSSFTDPLDTPDSHGTIYFTIAGQGVYQVHADNPDENPTHIRRLDHAKDDPISACESIESGHSKHDDTAEILKRLGPSRTPVRIDSQCKYAVVARGQADIYLRMPTRKDYVERIWDHAAGALVAAEAGCAVSDIAGAPLDFSRGRGLEKNRGIVCAPPALHGKIIGVIRELGLDR